VKKPLSGWLYIALLCGATAVGLAGLYFIGEQQKGQGESASRVPAAQEPGGAYAAGGQPQTSGPARVLFEKALPEFVIALDRWGRSEEAQAGVGDDELSELRGDLMGALQKADLSSELSTAFKEVIAASVNAATVEDSELDEAADSLSKTTLVLNDAIATAGLGFFIDTDVLTHRKGTRSVLLFSFVVSRVVLYRSGGHDVRTLRVRRLDNLNWTYSLLGFTSPRRRDAVVLDNKVDEHLMRLLPALSEEIRMDPFHLSTKDSETDWFNPLRVLATSIIREELGAAGGEDLQELGELLAVRRRIYARWNERLESRKMHIDDPSGLTIEWDYQRQMEGLVTNAAI
jgi:hypothetical protein